MIRVLCAIIVICGLGQAAAAADLTDMQKLQAENFQLKVQVAQLRATLADREGRLASVELSAQQAALVEEFRKTLKAEMTDVFDWATLRFRKPVEAQK